MDPIEIDMRVSPSLHPDAVPTSDEGARKALVDTYTWLRDFHDAEARIASDPVLSDYGKHAELEKVREATFKDASRELDRAEEILGRQVQRHEALVAQATKPEKATVDPKEIRSYVAGLPEAKRAPFVLQRAAAGDAETVAAIFSDVPLYLIGFESHKPAELAELKAEAERKLSAGAYEKLESARSSVARLHAMRRVLVGKYGRPGKA